MLTALPSGMLGVYICWCCHDLLWYVYRAIPAAEALAPGRLCDRAVLAGLCWYLLSLFPPCLRCAPCVRSLLLLPRRIVLIRYFVAKHITHVCASACSPWRQLANALRLNHAPAAPRRSFVYLAGERDLQEQLPYRRHDLGLDFSHLVDLRVLYCPGLNCNLLSLQVALACVFDPRNAWKFLQPRQLCKYLTHSV
jgi:hypothetical protein